MALRERLLAERDAQGSQEAAERASERAAVEARHREELEQEARFCACWLQRPYAKLTTGTLT